MSKNIMEAYLEVLNPEVSLKHSHEAVERLLQKHSLDRAAINLLYVLEEAVETLSAFNGLTVEDNIQRRFLSHARYAQLESETENDPYPEVTLEVDQASKLTSALITAYIGQETDILDSILDEATPMVLMVIRMEILWFLSQCESATPESSLDWCSIMLGEVL